MTSRRTVLAVLHEDVVSLNVTGPLEVFAAASTAVPDAYRITTGSMGGAAVRCSVGMMLSPAVDLDECEPPHTLLIPGGPVPRATDPRLLDRIRQLAAGAERVMSVCTGAFLLGEAGLLEQRRATTHWAFCDLLARNYPTASVAPAPMFVRDGNVSTSAGVTAGIDLALALVEDDLGADAALVIARALLVYLRRPGQEQFRELTPTRRAERHPLRELQEWIGEHPDADLSVDALARRVVLSPRQFARVFTDQVGMTPGQYVDRVRLDAARRRLEATTDGLESIARAVGYGSPEAMRRAFMRQLDVPPGEYRRRFQSKAMHGQE